MNDEDLRDLFAGLAMQGYLSTEYFRGMPHKFVAEEAYRMSDAMIEAKYFEPEEGIAKIKKRTRKPKSEQL
jgi:hypothetical protein